jgi:creatinine deaminase
MPQLIGQAIVRLAGAGGFRRRVFDRTLVHVRILVLHRSSPGISRRSVREWMHASRLGDAQRRLLNRRPVILDRMDSRFNPVDLLAVALAEARTGRDEGGIPIGAAIFTPDGRLLGSGRNRRVQHNDPSAHGETDAFRNAGRQRSYRDLIMVTTLAPCWYCSGLIRQFGFGTVIVGESRTFQGGLAWLRELGIEVINLDSQQCVDLLNAFIGEHPEIWNEDIGN